MRSEPQYFGWFDYLPDTVNGAFWGCNRRLCENVKVDLGNPKGFYESVMVGFGRLERVK